MACPGRLGSLTRFRRCRNTPHFRPALDYPSEYVRDELYDGSRIGIEPARMTQRSSAKNYSCVVAQGSLQRTARRGAGPTVTVSFESCASTVGGAFNGAFTVCHATVPANSNRGLSGACRVSLLIDCFQAAAAAVGYWADCVFQSIREQRILQCRARLSGGRARRTTYGLSATAYE